MSKFIALTLALCLVFGQVNAAVSPYIMGYSDNACTEETVGATELTDADFTVIEDLSVYLEL